MRDERAPAEGQVVHRPLRGGGDETGQGGGQRAEDDVDDALRRLDVAGGHGVGRARVEQGAGRDAHGQRGEDALIHRQVTQQSQGNAAQAVDDGRFDDGRHGVEVAGHSRGGAGEIDRQRVAGHGDGGANGHRGIALAIVVQRVGEAIDAVGDAGDGGAGQRLGVGDEGLSLAQRLGQAVAADDLPQTCRAGGVGGQLRRQVAVALPGRAHVAQDELPHRLVARATLDELDRGDDDPFLIEFSRERH